MRKLLLLISIFLMLVQTVSAGTDLSVTALPPQVSVFEVNGSPVSVPSPVGFVTTSDQAPELGAVFQQYFPQGTLLYDVYTTQADITGILNGTVQDLKKYFIMAQPVEMQKKRFTKADLIGIADVLRKQGKTLLEEDMKSDIESNIDRGNNSLTELVDEKVELKLNKLGFLGVFGSTENSVLFTIRAEVSTGKTSQKDTAISSSIFLLLEDRIVMIAAYNGERDAQTNMSGITWTQAEVVKWAAAILKANPYTSKAK